MSVFNGAHETSRLHARRLQPTFTYTCQQEALALLCLKVLSFAEIVNACLDILREQASANGRMTASTSSASAGAQAAQVAAASAASAPKVEFKASPALVEVSMLEILHCAMLNLPVEEVRHTWAALSVLFNEINPTTLTPRGCFLEFT